MWTDHIIVKRLFDEFMTVNHQCDSNDATCLTMANPHVILINDGEFG